MASGHIYVVLWTTFSCAQITTPHQLAVYQAHTRRMAGKIRLAADLGAQRRIRGKFSKRYQPAGWRVARPLTAAKHSENLTINPDVVQPAIRRVDAFVALLPRVCRSLRSLLNSRLTTFNPRRAWVVPVLSDNNLCVSLHPCQPKNQLSYFCDFCIFVSITPSNSTFFSKKSSKIFGL